MTDENNQKEFIWAVKNGELADVKMLLTKEAKLVNEQIEGRCPLHYAADYGQSEVISFLAEQGGDVNAEDKHGITPLLSAIYEGHTECVKILLAKGASKVGKAPSGDSYIDCAEKQDIKDLLQ